MMKDQFANYVVQKVLETCDDQQLELILNRIKVHLNALKKYTYGKHIVARVEKLVAAGGTFNLSLIYFSLCLIFLFFWSSSLVARISPFKLNKWEYQSLNLGPCILHPASYLNFTFVSTLVFLCIHMCFILVFLYNSCLFYY
jgi:hypothetical protein